MYARLLPYNFRLSIVLYCIDGAGRLQTSAKTASAVNVVVLAGGNAEDAARERDDVVHVEVGVVVRVVVDET